MSANLNLPGKVADTRVVVAMSGGVDSSVVAGIVKSQGYDVVGVTLQLYDHGAATHRKGACCAGQDIHDARKVAQQLDIPHYVLDYESRFKEKVIDSFAASYIAGETPIPCVSCNQTVKFYDLLETAKSLGAHTLATGHYIRTKEVNGKRRMYRPVDSERDQSYFLFATTQDQLDFLRFPLGDMTKSETREVARKLGLHIAEKSDSQDICFVPQGKYSDIIKRLQPDAIEGGEIVHVDGRVLGQHDGIIHYTVGQRRGIGVATGEPIYVVKLDSETNRVIVGPHDALLIRNLYLRDVNWIGPIEISAIPDSGMDLFVKVRSTRPPIAATLFYENNKVKVELLEGEAGISPGQACVFYENDDANSQVFGGGWIEHTEQISTFDNSYQNTATDAQVAQFA